MIVKANEPSVRKELRKERETTILSGVDWVGSLWNFFLGLVGLLMMLWFVPLSKLSQFAPRFLIWISVFAFPAILAGNRYSLVLSPEGIRLTLYRFWFVPLYRRRYLLDAEITLYETLEGTRPEGLVIHDPFWELLPEKELESVCFGPSSSEERLRTIVEALHHALAELRLRAPKPPLSLRHPLFGKREHCFDLAGAKRDASGRIRELRSTKEVDLGRIKIPAGSRFTFNGEGFIDPRRDDRLVSVVLAEPTEIVGLMACANASLFFFPSGQLSTMRSAFKGEVQIDGNWIRGEETIAFGCDGILSYFTLARPIVVGEKEIPEGSTVHRYPGDSILPAHLRCTLAGELALPELTLRPGEAVTVSGDGQAITAISPRNNIVVNGQTIRAGIVPIPLKRDLLVDIPKCAAFGIVLGANPT